MTLPNIQIFGKPLEKLVETISEGIGRKYKPKAIRNEADAEAYKIEVIAKAKAKALVIKTETDSEIALRAQERLYVQEINRQNNIENIVDKSVNYLEETVSETPVDEDWRTRFLNKAQDISSDKLQEVWAKILANEINSPGDISMRTLDILSNLSRIEAEILVKFVSLMFSAIYIIKFGVGTDELKNFGFIYADILRLREAGIIFSEDNIFANLKTQVVDDQTNGIEIKFGEKKYLITKKENIDVFRFPVLSLTTSGAEIAQFVKCSPDYNYLEKFIEHWSDKGYTFTEIIN